MSHWGGYALTQGFFYLEEDSYMLVCAQLMLTTPGAFVFGQKLIRDRSMEGFYMFGPFTEVAKTIFNQNNEMVSVKSKVEVWLPPKMARRS